MLLVVNKIENTLAFVDPATGQVTVKAQTGDGPHEVVTDGTRAYVANYGAQTPGRRCRSSTWPASGSCAGFDLGPCAGRTAW